ncbi:MAG TPA: Lar family restriction alleviation protein [Candidatus Olsenella pullicola]|nr:Lar family restriction alleviation protein [Candidatus Olsenella pullicola]
MMERHDVTGLTDDEVMAMLTPEMAEKGERDMERLRAVMGSLTDDTGQTAYSSMLKPCPFCGGRPWVQYFDYKTGLGMEARVVCGECHVSTSRDWESGRVTYLPTGEDVTKALVIEKAIKTWNRRVEP